MTQPPEGPFADKQPITEPVDGTRAEVIDAARREMLEWPEDDMRMARADALSGPLQRALVSPLKHLRDATDEILHVAPEITLSLHQEIRVRVGDRAGVERLVEATYLLVGWIGVDELIHGAWFLTQKRKKAELPTARAAGLILDELEDAAARLGQRIGRVLAAADPHVRAAALDVLAQSRKAAQPSRSGLSPTGDTWAFDGSSKATTTRNLAQEVIAAWAPVVKVRWQVSEKAREDIARDERTYAMFGLPPDGEAWKSVLEVWEQSPELKVEIDRFQKVLDSAARQRWLFDRWWDPSRVALDNDSDLAESLGDAIEDVLDANVEVAAAIRAEGGNPAWANAMRPDLALADSIRSEISAWRYRLLVTALTQPMGFLPGTFEWEVIHHVYDRVDLLARDDAEIDAILGKATAVAGMLSLIPPLRPLLAPLCAQLATWRVYHRWSQHAVEGPGWWAVMDPDFSSQGPAPDMTALLLETGLDLLDVIGVVPVATLLAASRRYLVAGCLVLKLAGTPGAALTVAATEMRLARAEMTTAAAAAQAAHAERQAAAAHAATPAPSTPPPAPARPTATTTPAAHEPKSKFPSDLAGQIETRLAPLIRTAAARAHAAPASPPGPPKLPPALPPTSNYPKRSKRKSKKRGKAKRPPPPDTPEQRRRRMGVPLKGELLAPSISGVKGNRPYRLFKLRVGDPVRRIERQRPDLVELLPKDIVGDLAELLPRVQRELWVEFGKRFKFTRVDQLFQWLHLSGPCWGVDVKPGLFGAYIFNQSAQARVENLSRRLKDLYLREGQHLFVEAVEYAHTPTLFPNAERFISEVTYTLSKGGPATSENTIVTISIKATTPRDYARTGQAVQSVDIDRGALFEDAVGVAPLQVVPYKRSIIPPGRNH